MNKQVRPYLKMRDKLLMGGGKERIEKQHAEGKLTARERIALLFDEGTFVEYGLFVKHRCNLFGMENIKAPGEGIITGYGLVDGRKVFAFAHDFTVLGGAMGEMQGFKHVRLQRLALDAGVPLVGLNDSGGARLQEGPDADGYGQVFFNNVQSSGVIPQISAIMGPCAGGAAYSPALTDFIVSVEKTSHMFITGPSVVKKITGETVGISELGGAMTHNSITGVSHRIAVDDRDCISQIKKYLSYFPSNCYEKPPFHKSNDDDNRRVEELNDIIPENRSKPYNVKKIIIAISDEGDFFEIMPYFARNIVIGYIRMGGYSVGVIANQPTNMAGCLDINASDKAARFIRTCDAFNIPLLSLVDVPGYLPGKHQEWGGIIRHGAKMLYAWAEATVPKIAVAMGKVYGGANPAMCSIAMEPDYIVAWPTAQRAVMGAESAVEVLYRKELKAAGDMEALRKKYIEEYNEKFMNPYRAAERGKYDDIIEPAMTRIKVILALHMFADKKKERKPRKHGNIPL